MIKYPKRIVDCLFLLVLITACHSDDTESEINKKSGNESMSAEHSRDKSKLAKLLNLDPMPESVIWSVSEYPGGNDWGLFAVLSYNPELAVKLQDALPVQQGEFEIEIQSWVPEHLLANIVRNEGKAKFDKTQSIGLYAKSPLLNGFAVSVTDTDVFVQMYTQ